MSVNSSPGHACCLMTSNLDSTTISASSRTANNTRRLPESNRLTKRPIPKDQLPTDKSSNSHNGSALSPKRTEVTHSAQRHKNRPGIHSGPLDRKSTPLNSSH